MIADILPASVVSTAPDPSKLNETTLKCKTIRQLNESHEKRPELMSMMKGKKRSIHGLGPIRGVDQRTLDVFFRESPKCPVCNGLYQAGTLALWIDGHILDCRIERPQYSGAFNRYDADMWFSHTYMPWVKEIFGADLA
ncbi:MAG: hypothetical protein ACYDAP_03600 [Thermoplasmataceae archaeon]